MYALIKKYVLIDEGAINNQTLWYLLNSTVQHKNIFISYQQVKAYTLISKLNRMQRMVLP